MPVDVRWYDEQEDILCYIIEGAWTWAEMHVAFERVVTLGGARPYRVDVIVNFGESLHVPADTLVNLGRLADRHTVPAQQGLNVIVTQSKFARRLLGIALRIYPKVSRFVHIVSSLEQALEIIARDRGETSGSGNAV